MIEKKGVRQISCGVAWLIYLTVSLLFDLFLAIFYNSLSIFICGIIGCTIVFLLSKKLDQESILLLMLYKVIGVCFILLAYYGNIDVYGTPYYIGGSDDLVFEERALRMISKGYMWPWQDNLVVNTKGFNWIISLIMRMSVAIGGTYHTMAYRILNIYLLSTIGTILFNIYYTRIEPDEQKARLAMSVVCLFPNAMYLSSLIFRDTLCTLLIIVFFAFADDFFKSKDEGSILTSSKTIAAFMMISLAFWGFWIRNEMLYIMILIFGTSILKSNHIKGKTFLIYVVILLLSMIILYQIGAIDKLIQKTESAMNYHYVSDGSDSISRIVFNTPILPFGIIVRILYGLVFPLPVGILGLFSIFDNGLSTISFLVAVGMCVQITHLPLLIKNAISRLDKYSIIFITIFLTIVVSSYTFRHFIMAYPFMSLLIIREYYAETKREKQINFLLSCFVLCLATFVYVIIK